MQFAIHLITTGCVIVSCNIQRIQHRGGDRIGMLGVGRLVHAGPDKRSHDVEHQAGILHFLLLLTVFRLLLFLGLHAAAVVGVDALAAAGPFDDHQVDASSDRAAAVQRMQQIHHLVCQCNTLILGGFRHLVADGVSNDAGVIVVPLGHGSQILLPVSFPVVGVIVAGFVVVPHIPRFINHVDTVSVAGVQHGGGARVMG